MSPFSGKSIAIMFACLIGIVRTGFAYEEWSIPNVTAPTVIEPVALEVHFQHQFLGHIKGDKMFSRLFGVGDGHQFFVFIGNSTETGPRHLMRGASDDFLRVGFLVSRLFSFSPLTDEM